MHSFPEAAPVTTGLSGRRILFISREPILHQMGGSTTYALALLELLARHGADVTLLTATAYSRSPRLWFRVKAELPRGVHFIAPGMWRIGKLYLKPLSGTAWARFLVRLAVRLPVLLPISRRLQKRCGDGLACEAWDLSTPTAQERAVATSFAETLNAATVIVNYAFWGPLFASPELTAKRRVVLMHDLLSARVKKFVEAGLPLDCRFIDESTELGWLNHADCLLAAQEREAEAVRPHVHAAVVVPPMVFTVQRARGEVVSKRCLFVGSNIVPNRTGLEWFLAHVWPLVRAQDPRAELAVVGSVCGAIDSAPAGVTLEGMVPSMEEEYARAAVCIVPLLVGSGIKIKLVEALSFGKAAVSTTIGVQGLEEWVGDAVAVTDDSAEFAAAVVRLLKDEGERTRAEAAGLALVQKRFGVQAELPRDFVEGIAGI